MKLKNVLVLAFLTLTLIPILVASILLYISGFNLSKESYTRNLIESINVQVDYISQTIENDMIFHYRFATRSDLLLLNANISPEVQKSNLLSAFETYLESSGDKVTSCILLDKNNVPIYTIGEENIIDIVGEQLPDLQALTNQTLMEFELEDGVHSLGIVTPVWDEEKAYVGSLVSIYDESYIFKIISSYYEIADTSTYICRENGAIINYRGLSDEKRNAAATKALDDVTFEEDGVLDMKIDAITVSGYYKNIQNSPWYLIGFTDEKLIYSFTNQFILGYILFIIGILIVDIILSFYFSRKVVEPINNLIKVMDGYQNNLNSKALQHNEKNGYYETQYLSTKFLNLMEKILLVQHNFEGIYQLYQSSDMEDTNINIDVKDQTILSNKAEFQKLVDEMDVQEGACIVENFINCFCDKDQFVLTDMFENMRDEHLSIPCEAELYTPHFGEKWFHTLVVPMYENDRLSQLFVQLRDISNFKKQEFESSEQAKRDGLTGLYNRLGFEACVKEVMQEDGKPGLHGLMFIDMDFFKMVNDNLGHSAGDDLLRSIGKLLIDTIGESNIVSRFGGDEFVVLLPHTSVNAIAKVEQELSESLFYPFQTEKTSFVVSASIGVTTWDQSSQYSIEELLKQADTAMYQAKREFKEKHINQ